MNWRRNTRSTSWRISTFSIGCSRPNPTTRSVQAALGRRDLKNGDYQAAAAHLRRAVENDATTATTYSDLADALAHLGDTEQAIPLLEKAIDLEPI